MKNIRYPLFLLLAGFVSCKKLIEVNTPQNQLTTDKVFADSSSAISAMVNVYAVFNTNADPNYNKYMSLYTDDMNAPQASGNDEQFLTSVLSAKNGVVGNFWSYNYNAIYSCNLILEQLKLSKNLSAHLISSMSAEAKFLRAYSYFYLVNSFGQVPLVLGTSVDQNAKAARTDTATVYNQIISDLQDAVLSLPLSYIGDIKVRANKWAATALLARVQLYRRNYPAAEALSSSVINSGNYALDLLTSVFLASSNETILSFYTQNGFIADAPNLIPQGAIPPFILSTDLINSFETGDQRKVYWTASFSDTTSGAQQMISYANKYHNGDVNTSLPEYLVALRLAEQYLIRAESKAVQRNITGAVADLNMIRQRAGLSPLSAGISQQECLAAARREWRSEFFAEWGHRFLELKRTGLLSSVMKSYKASWTDKAALLPIPQSDLAADPFLTQNSGY